MTQRTLLLSCLILLFGCSILPAQESEESTLEFNRETVREKIRFDLDKFNQLPTVGQIREAYKAGGDDPEKVLGGAAALAAVESIVSGDTQAESEVHAAINPTDSNNIVVSPIRQTSQSLLCPIYYTKDFGRSWHKSQFLNLPPQLNAVVFGGGDPVFAFDADGRLYFTWIDLYATSDNDSTLAGIFWAKSDDGGETWDFGPDNVVILDAVRAGAPAGIYQLPRFNDKQWMAVDRTTGPRRNTLYVSYVELNLASGGGLITVRRLTPESGKFTTVSTPVSDGSFALVQFSSIGVDDKGNVHVSFFGSRNDGEWGIWHSVSIDGGQSFSDPERISLVRFGQARFGGQDSEKILGINDQRLYPSPYMATDNSNAETGGNVYTVWTALGTTNHRGKGFDIYFSRLEGFNDPENPGEWSEPIIVNDDGTATDQFYPSITVSPEGVVIVTWYDKRGDAAGRQTHYYMAYSFDGGKTFTKNIQVTSKATDFSTIGRMNGGFGIGEYTQVLATPSYAIPVWGDGRLGSGNIDIYAAVLPISRDISDAPLYPERVTSVEEGMAVGEVVPNPVSGGDASLTFHLEHSARVGVDLIDMTGAVVRHILLNHSFDAGEHRITIPTDDLAGGTYFCRVATEKGTATRKVTVVE